MKRGFQKKAVSPIIATVLLIVLVIVIAIIIFLWFKGMTDEAVTKFGGTNVELICDQVSFEGDYNSGKIYISNTGNVPIYNMKVKIYKEKGYETSNLEDWPELGINQGGVYEEDFDGDDIEKIVLIPVLLGKSERGKRAHTCDEGFHGLQIDVN